MYTVARLRRAFAAIPAVEYRQNLYRTTRLIHIKTSLSGAGATITGARFTRVGGPETLYLAEDPLTAFIEFHHQNLKLLHERDDPFVVRLGVIATVVPQVVLDPKTVLDLTRHEVRVAVGTDLTELASPWAFHPGPGLPPTQLLGREAFNSKWFQAIRYPSARNPGGVCLAVFVARLVKGGPAYLDLDDVRNGGTEQRIPAT